MRFLPELRDFLRKHGAIYTVRGYNMRPAWVGVDGVGRWRRTSLGKVHSMVDLKPYAEQSGFSDVKSWWSKIEFFCSGRDKWLYKIEVECEVL